MAQTGSYLSGLWYPSNANQLNQVFETAQQKKASLHSQAPGGPVPNPGTTTPTALVMPHAGLTYSARGQIAALNYLTPDIQSILILSPSHRVALPRDAFVWAPVETWHTPLGTLPGLSLPNLADNPRGFTENIGVVAQEHGIELMLPGLAWKTARWNQKPVIGALVVPSVSREEHIANLSNQLNSRVLPLLPQPALILVSSDFCHYGPRFSFSPWGSFSRGETRQRVKQEDLEIAQLAGSPVHQSIQSIINRLGKPTMPTICGIIPLLLAVLTGTQQNLTGFILDYYHSDEGGQDENAVAYCPMVFTGEKGLQNE